MKRRLCSAILCGVLFATVHGLVAAELELPLTYTQAAVNPSRTVMVGVTLGQGWAGFPTVIAADFEPVDFWDKLDVELELYVNWMLDTSDPAYSSGAWLPYPVPLRLFSWFSGHHSEFQLVEVSSGGPENVYKPCPPGSAGLEAPQQWSFPLTSDGKLRLTDIHGGLGNLRYFHLKDCRPTQDDPACGEMYSIWFGWLRPDRWPTLYPDWTPRREDYPLGTFYNWATSVNHGGNSYYGWFQVPTVEWVSADIGNLVGSGSPSPLHVDATDLAYYSVYHGQPVRWGLSGEYPPESPNYMCNLAPFGYSWNQIDAADLSMLTADLNDECLLTKPGASSEVAAMLEWFGIAPSGQMVVVGPNGETLPEYDIVDWEQNRRAVVDPYGYRRTLDSAPAKEAPWGLVKQLFR